MPTKTSFYIVSIMVILSLCNTNLVWAQSVSIEPKEVNLIISEEEAKKDIPISFVLTSDKDLNDIQVLPSSVIADKSGLHIDHNKIDIKTPLIDLVAGQQERLVMNLDLKDVHPGKYSGKILLTNKEIHSEIPITISLSTSSIIPLIPIAIGVSSNFLIKYAKRVFSHRQAVKTAFDEAELAYNQVTREKKKMNYPLLDGINYLRKAGMFFQDGNLVEAKKNAIEAKKSFDVANVQSDDPSAVVSEPDEKISIGITPFIKEVTAGKETIVFLGISIIVGAAVLSVWTEFIAKFGPFGISYLDYVSAFLYGFASQALLGEALDLGKNNS